MKRASSILVFFLLCLGPVWPAGAQGDLRAEERGRELAAVEVKEVPLVRHLVPVQELAFWLPADFELQTESPKTSQFLRQTDGLEVRFGRFPSEPGASLIQAMDNLLAGFERNDRKVEVTSRRRLQLAERPAIEVAGTLTAKGELRQVRLLLLAQPGGPFVRLIRADRKDGSGEPLDAFWSRLLRDYTPLDGSIGTAAFERLRRQLVAPGPALAAAQRNRLLAEIARPDALGERWVAERLEALARQNSSLLLDGLVHPHPRVRGACYAALEPAAIAAGSRARLFALALQDQDAAVRFRASQRVVALPGLAAETFDRILDTDNAAARGGAFQLLASLPAGARAELLEATFGQLEHYPVASQIWLARLLDRWAAPAAAQKLLWLTYKKSREEGPRKVALELLLARGHQEALQLARERLRQPQAAGLIELPWAAEAVATWASRPEANELEALVKGLAAADSPAALESSRKVLQGLLTHWSGMPASALPAEECACLGSRERSHWAWRRRDALGCPAIISPPVARLTLPRPGLLLDSVFDQLQRLEVGTPAQNDVFHFGFGMVTEQLETWGGDPFSMASTGLDLSAPLEISWWGQGGADRSTFGSRFSLRAGQFERLEDSLLRLSAGSPDLETLSQGILAMQVVPLVPAALGAFWQEELELRQGRGKATTEKSAKPQKYVALTGGDAATGALGISRLEVDTEGVSSWSEARFERRQDRLIVTLGEPPAGAPEPAAAPEPAPAAASVAAPAAAAAFSSSLEVDLSAFLKILTAAAPKGEPDEVPPGLRLHVRSELGDPEITTFFELSGVDPGWLAVAGRQAPATLAAPAELLPAGAPFWLNVSFEPKALAALLETRSADLLDAFGPKLLPKLVAAAPFLKGEAGLVAAALPESAPVQGEAWEPQLLLYFTVEPKAADAYLARNWPRSEKIGALRVHRLREKGSQEGGEPDDFAVRIGRFLVIGQDPAVFARLGKAPFLAASEAYRNSLERLPGEAALVASFDTQLVAAALRQSYAARGDAGSSILVVEMIAALGPIAGSLRSEGGRLVGQVAIAPKRLPAAAVEHGRELKLFSSYLNASVATDPFPPKTAIAEPWKELELRLELPPTAADPGFAWATERLDQQQLTPQSYRLVSRAALPLPETSKVQLPIKGQDLLPFLRNEHNLGLHLDAVRQQAEKIRGQEKDPAKIVRAIVEWAHLSLEYQVIRQETSVEEILATRRADCTEFSQLTIALARSLGIPARPVGGIYVGADGAILHRWVEVYLDRWYEIDPTFGVVAVPATSLRLPGADGNFLAVLPGSRFVFEKATGSDGVRFERDQRAEP